MIQVSNSKCVGWIGRIFGHRFEPRYHEHARAENMVADSRWYSCDVCVRCGTIVDLPSTGDNDDDDNDDDSEEEVLPIPVGDELRTNTGEGG